MFKVIVFGGASKLKMAIEQMVEEPVKVEARRASNIGKFALDYMLNRGSSNREIMKMVQDKSLVYKAAQAFTDDKRYLAENGFSAGDINELVLCKPSIYRFLLVSNGHPLCQKSSTCISRASFYSL